jgi:hypothetical protein
MNLNSRCHNSHEGSCGLALQSDETLTLLHLSYHVGCDMSFKSSSETSASRRVQ